MRSNTRVYSGTRPELFGILAPDRCSVSCTLGGVREARVDLGVNYCGRNETNLPPPTI